MAYGDVIPGRGFVGIGGQSGANFDGLRAAQGKTNWYNNVPVQQGIGYNNATVGAGLNMLGGGTNLYGGSGAAIVPNGPIRVGGGSSGPMDFQSWLRQYSNQNYGTVNIAQPEQYRPQYQQYVNQMREASITPAQRLATEVKQKFDQANQANENRYQTILEGDTAGREKAFMSWLKGKYPKANTNMLNKLVANPNVQAQYNKENPSASASYGGYRDRYTRNMGYLEGQGGQQRQDINRDYDNLNARQQQNLAARGLMNSTIGTTMQNASERSRQNSLMGLQESLNRQRLATDSQLSGDMLQFMERKNEVGPSYGEYINLMAQLGQAGGAGYGGYGGGGGGNQLGVGTMMNGVPMQYAGQRATSSRGVAMGSGGLNAPSAYSMARNY